MGSNPTVDKDFSFFILTCFAAPLSDYKLNKIWHTRSQSPVLTGKWYIFIGSLEFFLKHCSMHLSRSQSAVRPSTISFSYFWLLLWNHWTESAETWKKEELNVLYQVYVFFSGRSEKRRMIAPAFGWPSHFRLLLWNRWMELAETQQEARTQRYLPSLRFSGKSWKHGCRPASDFRLFLCIRWTK